LHVKLLISPSVRSHPSVQYKVLKGSEKKWAHLEALNAWTEAVVGQTTVSISSKNFQKIS